MIHRPLIAAIPGPEGLRNLAPGIARGSGVPFLFCTPEGCRNL